MRVVLTRHYQTESNLDNRILGWTDSPPRDGWSEDVEYVVDRLQEEGIQPEAIYCSDLARSRETARRYAALLGMADINEQPDLREINYGSLQTKAKKWVSEHYPGHKKDPDFVYPGGESFRQMQARGVRCLSSLVQAHTGQTILVVSHAGLIRGIVSHCLDLEFRSSLKYHVPFRYIGCLRFAETGCVGYREIGNASGFVQADVPNKFEVAKSAAC